MRGLSASSCSTQRSTTAIWILCILLIVLIATIDLEIPLGVAMGIPYIAVVLLALWLSRRATILMAIVCSVLTVGIYFYKPVVPDLWKALTNRALAVFAIWVTATLGLERKRAEDENEKAVHAREQALEKLRILRGLLPICASCKKIKTDGENWKEIESYIHDHSEANFTHGLCPDCLVKLYPEDASQIFPPDLPELKKDGG